MAVHNNNQTTFSFLVSQRGSSHVSNKSASPYQREADIWFFISIFHTSAIVSEKSGDTPLYVQSSVWGIKWEEVICLIAIHACTHTCAHAPISCSAQGWQAFTFKRLLWKAPLQCRRFQPQLYGEYIVVKLLMKMEESVYSSKQLSVKDGEVIYSLYEEQYFFPSDCHSFNEELTYLGGMIQE